MTKHGRRLLRILGDAAEVLQKPVRGFRFARNLLKDGGHVIETSFEYQNRTFVLRTVIGFGDVINFIPDPTQAADASDEEWQSCYKRHISLHFQKIKAFLNAFKQQSLFWENGLKGIVGAANVYPVYQAFLAGEWAALLVPIASVLYLHFFGKTTARQIVRGLWQLLGRLVIARRKSFGW